MYYSGMMQGFHILLEFWTNLQSTEGVLRAPLCYSSWIVLGTVEINLQCLKMKTHLEILLAIA